MPYLAFTAFLKASGLDLTYVPYRNPFAALPDLAEGRVDLAFLPLAPLVGPAQAGKLRLVAVASDERGPLAPDVPTAAEAGFPALSLFGGHCLYAPKEMPEPYRRGSQRTCARSRPMPTSRGACCAMATSRAASCPKSLPPSWSVSGNAGRRSRRNMARNRRHERRPAPAPSPARAPAQVLAGMLAGAWLAQALGVVARLGVADLLDAGPRTPAEIATATGTDAGALYRVLRALAGAGVFAEDESGRFGLTPLAGPLRTGAGIPSAPTP